MAYFKINNNDYSQYVNKLIVDTTHKYTARENASGNLLVKHITKKKKLQVGIIPLDASSLTSLMEDLDSFECTVTYLEPKTNTLETINCIIPVHSIEYYSIRAGNIMTKAFTFACEEK
ncbi:MAG: hypothetical protein IKB64_03465 [Paludibacteraceae bacterium]|nr:hypothetical protein [Paludibacteraceae bacterium]